MKKRNIVLAVFVSSILLMLLLQPVSAEALEVMSQVPTDTLAPLISATLTPIWVILARASKKVMGD